MPQLKKRQSFITPFSQTSSISSQNADVQAQSSHHCHQGEEKITFSPVHLGHNVQIITPQTRHKIKQRVALGFSNVCVRDTSPGIHVPFDLSQASCISQPTRVEENLDHEEKERSEVDTELKECHITTDQDTCIQGFQEEYDLELLEVVTDMEIAVKENGNITEFTKANIMNQQDDQAVEPGVMEPIMNSKKHKKNNVGVDEELRNISKEAGNEAVTDENNVLPNLKSKKVTERKNAKEKSQILKTQMFRQSFVKRKTLLKQKRQFCKLDTAAKNNPEIGDTAQSRKITQKRGDISLTEINTKASCDRKDAIETSDFCPLTSSHSSQNVANCKRKRKRSFQTMKQEVLKTLYKMHNEIQELIERRKLLDKSGDMRGRQIISSELQLHSKLRKHDVVQEE